MTIAKSIAKTWQVRNQREKQLLTIAAALLISWLGWVLLVNPALRGRAHWQRELPGIQSELAQMRSLLTEMAKLHNQVAEADIRKSAQRNGMQTLRMDGERWLKEGVTSEAELLRVTKD